MSIEPSGQGGRQLVVVDLTFAREPVLAGDDRAWRPGSCSFRGVIRRG